MNVYEAVTAAVCLCQLGLALFCLSRTARSPLALPLALLFLDIFGWSAAGFAYEESRALPWRLLDHMLTPWTAPLALNFTLMFVGRRRALRPALYVAFVSGSAVSAVAASAFFVPSIRPFIGSTPWGVALLSVAIPTMAFAIVVLARHLRESTEPTERIRTVLIFAAFAIGTLLGATEEFKNLVPVPGLGDFGMLAGAALLAVVAFRFRLFESDVSLRAIGFVLAFTGIGAVVALVAFRYLDAIVALPVLVSGTVSLALIAASRRWLAEGAQRRMRQASLATLGRFSAQMAHDLKNPLAALKGAAQVLHEDLGRPTPGVDRSAFARLMLDQIDRLDGLVDVYGRLARVEPVRDMIDLNEMSRTVLALQSHASDRIAVKTELEDDLPPCRADREMLSRVLENLMRNAIEAMPEGGTVTVGTARASGDTHHVIFSVKDTGCGMDARTRERAFDDFFTTKTHGSGLGLAFVRRVVEAHEGQVTLESEQGRGTVVSMRLPLG